MKLMWIISLLVPVVIVVLSAAERPARAEGGELGNAFVPFDSRIGHFTLEYSKDWRVNDLSEATSFDENTSAAGLPSFFTVEVDSAGATSLSDLGAKLRTLRPDINWASATVGGLAGFGGFDHQIKLIYLLRAPGDQLNLRMRSTDGARSEEILSHMLGTFRAE